MSNDDFNTERDTFFNTVKSVGYHKAHAMPGRFYTDSEFLKSESEELFGKHWVCVGRVEEIPSPGDYLTCIVAEEPIVVIRENKGSISAISNVCRHRGTVLLEGSGNIHRIVCPYHHWSYGLDGQLLSAPFVEERDSFSIKNCRLPAIRHDTWQGFFFVTLDAEAPDLIGQLGTLDGLIGDYHLADMKQRWSSDECWDINWKHLMENFMEGYHLSPLHRDTLHNVNPSSLCKHIKADGEWFGYQVGFAERVSSAQVGHAGLTEDQLNTCIMFAVPPALAVGVGSDYSSYLCLRPVSVNQVDVKMGLLFYGDEWTDQELDTAVSLFEKTMEEDKSVLLRVRDGVSSRHFVPGPLANPALEGTLWDFYRYIAKSIS